MAGIEFGVIGLGKMGTNFSLHAVRKGMRVVGYSQTINEESRLQQAGVELTKALADVPSKLSLTPRRIFLYVPAGPAVDAVIDALVPLLSPNDILIDAGNSHFRDSIVRQERLAEIGIGFIDCGSSGGPDGALTGGCFMVGGTDDDVKHVAPILKELAVRDGYIHAGPSGAGHFTKLIHNAIEFGMLQSIAEGLALLKASEYTLDLPALFHNWSNGSVIRGWLVELMEKGLRENPDVSRVPSYVEDTGEVNWVVEEAIRNEVAIPVITQSVMQLFASRDSAKIAHRAVAILRHKFGHHPFGKDAGIENERRFGYVGLTRKKRKGRAA